MAGSPQLALFSCLSAFCHSIFHNFPHICFPFCMTFSVDARNAASSTAVLVQLTPLLGALVGVIATLILVAICVVIFIKFRSKRGAGGRRHGNGGEATTTEADKGSAEPLSRNMGSHSSLEDKIRMWCPRRPTARTNSIRRRRPSTD